MSAPLVLALVVGAPVAWPNVAAAGDQAPPPAPGAAPRATSITLECTAPAAASDRAGTPMRLTCKVHGLELVVYALDGVPRFWETVDPFSKDGTTLAPRAAHRDTIRTPVRRRPPIDDLIEPFGPTTMLAGRQMELEVELLDPYVDEQPARSAPELIDPFGVSPPEVPVPPPLPLPSPGRGEDPDGMVPLPR